MDLRISKLPQKYVKVLKLAAELGGYSNWPKNDIRNAKKDDLDRAFGVLAPCDGIAPAEHLDEEVSQTVISKFGLVFWTAAEMVRLKHPKAEIRTVIQPSYEYSSTIVVINEKTGKVLYINQWRAWNYSFDGLGELAKEIISLAKIIEKAL